MMTTTSPSCCLGVVLCSGPLAYRSKIRFPLRFGFLMLVGRTYSFYSILHHIRFSLPFLSVYAFSRLVLFAFATSPQTISLTLLPHRMLHHRFELFALPLFCIILAWTLTAATLHLAVALFDDDSQIVFRESETKI